MTAPMTLESSDLGQTSVSALETLSRDQKSDIVSWVKKQYQGCKDQRTKFERSWYVNLAFYLGKQNVALITSKTAGTKLYTPKAPYWRSRPIINRIRPIVRKEISKLMSSEPTSYVVPASSEDKDLFASQAGESIWRSIYDDKDLQQVFTRGAFWTTITGTGFLKCWWDESAIDEINNMPGDICYEAITPFHIFIPDVEQVDLERQPYIIHAGIKPLEWAQLNYGHLVEYPIAATSRSDTIMDTGFLKLIGADDPPLDSVEVIEVWVKPGQYSRYPMGCLIILVGDQLAYYSESWPSKYKEYPFSKITHIPTGGFYGDSIITDLISLQQEFNRTRGQIIESKNKMAKPQLLAPKGSINPNSITTEPGLVILYRPGFERPTPLPLQSLPTYVLDELERIKMDMDDISGQHEVSRGTVPPGVTAATAISYLQEQDDTMLVQTVKSLERAVQKIARLTLNYVVEYWDVGRMVKVTGADGSFDVISLMGADLEGNNDIRIEKDSALPTSRSAKQAFLMDLMKMGFIDPNYGLELMEVGGLNKLYEQLNVDKRQAQRENIRMQKLEPNMVMVWSQANTAYNQSVTINPDGTTESPMNPQTGQTIPPPPVPVPVNAWDNHMVHLQVHNNFRKSQTFEVLPDEVKQIFQAHISMHEAAVRTGAVSPELGYGQPAIPESTLGAEQATTNQGG